MLNSVFVNKPYTMISYNIMLYFEKPVVDKLLQLIGELYEGSRHTA